MASAVRGGVPGPGRGGTAAAEIPPEPDLEVVREAAAGCRACPLWVDATRTVFGEGDPRARWMLVGEIPGDEEDRDGHPFVGPAGRLLDRCLEEVGLDRSTAWVTNAVKHFKFKYRVGSKKRIHDRPRQLEIAACRPWLAREIELVSPEVLVCLGATAVRSVLGPGLTLAASRGRPLPSELAPWVLVTVHPSSVLRARAVPGADAEEERRRFVEDLSRIPELLSQGAPARAVIG